MEAIFEYPVLLAAVVTLGLAAAYWRMKDLQRDDAERSTALQLKATERGWAYTLNDPAARKEVGLSWGWGSRWERNFMRGREGDADFIVYDQFTEHKNSPRRRATYAAFRMRQGFPRFRILPNTLQMSLQRNLFWSKVEFPEDPHFTEYYRVESPEADQARTAFDERIRAQMMTAPGWQVDSEKGWLRVTDGTIDGGPEAVAPFQAKAWELAKLFPEPMKELQRCPWPIAGDELYLSYHDKEWGVPVRDDRKIFEFLVLEAFQAGLSWRTVLYKRENFRKAFAGFDVARVSRFNSRDTARLMGDAGIIRNGAKIAATVNNAARFIEVRAEFGTFSKYMWSWVEGRPVLNRFKTVKDYPPYDERAEAWAADLKKRGFKFLGPTVLYAHMQAIGMVNDHTVTCFRYKQLSK